jgi:hypothetical protein
MTAKKHYSIFAAILIFVVCANLLNVHSVLADGETPTEPPAATEVVTEPPVESTPIPVESTPDPVEATAAPVEEILTQVPESTEVVILDESGNSVPLATEEAAQIAEVVDPMWCPEGVSPGGAGCTTNFSSIGALLTYMAGPSHTASFAQNGIIYFTASPGGGTLELTDSNLGSSVFDTLNDYNLTLQGGWNGDSVSPSFSGQSNFGTSEITIGNSLNPWVGNITLNDITFMSNTQTSLTVYTTTGNITLSNVDVNNQRNGSNTALLSTSSGNINVTDGTYDGNAANSAGFSATTGSGSITITDTSFTDNRKPGNDVTYDGATLSAPIVTLTNVTATHNDGDGITVNNANVVTLNNVVASNNGTGISPPPGLAGNDGSGILINGNVGSNVFINGGTFNNNQEYGVEVGNPANTTIYIQSAPACTGNDSNAAPTNSCYNFTPIVDNTAPVITPSVSGTAGLNGWYTSDVNVSWSVSDAESGTMSSTGCTASNLTAETSGVTLTCSATNNVDLSNSVSVTIKIDKSAPTLTLPSNITTTATGPSGAVVDYSVSATDNFDPSISAICSPASGSTFGLGTTTANCSSTDEAGNTATGSFQVTVNAQAATPTDTPAATPPTPAATSVAPTNTSSGSSTSNTTSSLIIPLTGGVIDLDCNSSFSMFGIKLTFLNLCDQQTTIKNVTADSLPGKLPQSFSFVMGLDVKVLSNGQAIQALPNGTGIEMDFPISGTDQFAVLYWNGSSWVEISQQISEDKISQVVGSSTDNALYQILSSGDAFYKILTTDKTGVFVLVKK